jgi:hypothetical protein
VSAQLQLELEEPLAFVARDLFGRPLATVEVDETLGDKAWHEAVLWCYLAAKTARLPAPPWVTFPC